MTTASLAPLPTLVADTHTLIWHLLGSSKLSPNAQMALQQVDSGQGILIIPAVVLAELFMVVERKRIALSPAVFAAAVKTWQTAENIRLTSLTPDIVVESAYLTAIPDIFDRLIVTETRRLGIPLITMDPVITNSQLVPVIW